MQTFLFYPYRSTGAAMVFLTADFPDLAAAAAHGVALLDEHQTADLVEVWEGDVLRQTIRRVEPDAGLTGWRTGPKA